MTRMRRFAQKKKEAKEKLTEIFKEVFSDKETFEKFLKMKSKGLWTMTHKVLHDIAKKDPRFIGICSCGFCTDLITAWMELFQKELGVIWRKREEYASVYQEIKKKRKKNELHSNG